MACSDGDGGRGDRAREDAHQVRGCAKAGEAGGGGEPLLGGTGGGFDRENCGEESQKRICGGGGDKVCDVGLDA